MNYEHAKELAKLFNKDMDDNAGIFQRKLDEMDEQKELIRALAVEIYGLEPDQMREFGNTGAVIKRWNPLTNENHTALIRDKLVSEGFDISEKHLLNDEKDNDSAFVVVKVFKRGMAFPVTGIALKKDQSINLTRCKAMLEAWRKFKDSV